MKAFLKKVKAEHPGHFWRVRVLDCGSLDINGSSRDLWNIESGYTGIDLAPGPNVNVVMPIEKADWLDEHFHVCISTECFEHNPKWREGLQNMVRMLRPGGLLIVTCATAGRSEHGTQSATPEDSPFTADSGYYCNLTEGDLRQALDLDMFDHYAFETNAEAHDLYFHAVKRGTLIHGCTCDDELGGINVAHNQWMKMDT
jgi:SAM-dependent methyltransferase